MKKRIIEPENQKEFKFLGLDISQISLIIVNLIPLFGVLFLGWEIISIMVFYSIQTIIIGIYGILKIILSKKEINTSEARRYTKNQLKFIIIFFKIIIILLILPAYYFSLAFLPLFIYLIIESSLKNINILSSINLIFKNFSSYLLIPFIFLMINHGVSFYKNFILKKEYNNVNLADITTELFSRVFLMYYITVFVVLIVGITRIVSLIVLITVLTKTILDLYSHNREHNTPIFKKN